MSLKDCTDRIIPSPNHPCTLHFHFHFPFVITEVHSCPVPQQIFVAISTDPRKKFYSSPFHHCRNSHLMNMYHSQFLNIEAGAWLFVVRGTGIKRSCQWILFLPLRVQQEQYYSKMHLHYRRNPKWLFFRQEGLLQHLCRNSANSTSISVAFAQNLQGSHHPLPHTVLKCHSPYGMSIKWQALRYSQATRHWPLTFWIQNHSQTSRSSWYRMWWS